LELNPYSPPVGGAILLADVALVPDVDYDPIPLLIGLVGIVLLMWLWRRFRR
jgi:hypothetical protein